MNIKQLADYLAREWGEPVTVKEAEGYMELNGFTTPDEARLDLEKEKASHENPSDPMPDPDDEAAMLHYHQMTDPF